MPTQHIAGEWGLESSKIETGIHQHITSLWAWDGGPFLSSTPVATVQSGWAWSGTPTKRIDIQSVRSDWAWGGSSTIRVGVVQTVESGWAWEGQVNTLIPSQTANSYAIDDSVPSGVLPFPGSGAYKIFSKWQANPQKEVRVFRYGDSHETGGIDEDLTRHAWSLEVNVDRIDMLLFWNFIKSHYGDGVPFYFYDLQMNGWEYDPTGVSTNGRYLVRFDGDEFLQSYRQGERFVIPFNLIEVV